MCGITAIINGVEVLDPKDIKYGGTNTTNDDNQQENNNNIRKTSTTTNNNDRELFYKDLESRLLNRGPDSVRKELKQVFYKKSSTSDTDSNSSISITLVSSVLGLRGPLTPQPLHDESNGNILLWNGELFDGYDIGVHDNDTKLLLHLLSGIKSSDPREILDIMVKIKGPFAFIFWHEKERRLWFGRDVLGRRSLMVNRNDHSNENDGGAFIISSMGVFPNGIDDSSSGQSLPKWFEVNTFGLYSIHFPEVFQDDQQNQLKVYLESHSWDIKSNLNLGITAIDYDSADNDDDSGTTTTTTTNTTTSATTSTTNTEDNSNLDNQINQQQQQNEFQDQINAIDQLHFYPFGRRIKMVPDDGEWRQVDFDRYVDEFYKQISKSIYTRVCNLPDISMESPDLIRPSFNETKPIPLPGRIGILFSGGLDSMVLAAVTNQHVPKNEPIHLINVAFGENCTVDNYDIVPDRKTAIQGLKELRVIAPDREWILIKVNVTNDEMEWAKKIVYQLSYPAITIMDMTISLALWFAARGEGIIHYDENQEQQQQQRVMTTAKVLLMGSGADEQLAGYGRHRSAFQRGSWQVLQSELNKDFNRIWKRNLGRDDRVISSNRREPRFPYLDENLIEFLNNVPLSYICDPSLGQGIGDKRILRQVAKNLGLTESTKLVKKAIQFGSKSSKQLNKNVPARVTQKCGKEVFSFTTPLYNPEQDPGYQKHKTKQMLNIERKRLKQLKKQQQQENNNINNQINSQQPNNSKT
eukprot:gene7589-9330_t